MESRGISTLTPCFIVVRPPSSSSARTKAFGFERRFRAQPRTATRSGSRGISALDPASYRIRVRETLSSSDLHRHALGRGREAFPHSTQHHRALGFERRFRAQPACETCGREAFSRSAQLGVHQHIYDYNLYNSAVIRLDRLLFACGVWGQLGFDNVFIANPWFSQPALVVAG